MEAELQLCLHIIYHSLSNIINIAVRYKRDNLKYHHNDVSYNLGTTYSRCFRKPKNFPTF